MKWLTGLIVILILIAGGYYLYPKYFTHNTFQTVVSSPTKEVDLKGTLEVKKLNGEDVLFLELPQPINIQGSGEDALHQGFYTGITEIQLDSSPIDMDLSDTSGQKSEVVGILEDSKTKTQYTPVVLQIHTMKHLDK